MLSRAGLIDHSRAMFNFAPDGSLAGRSFCNTYRGEDRLTGETLTLSVATTTQTTCPPALMQQEQLFLGIVQAVGRLSLSADGALILEAANARGSRSIAARANTRCRTRVNPRDSLPRDPPRRTAQPSVAPA